MSPEHNVESVIIALLSELSELDGITISHHDSTTTAEANQITVKATRGERRLDGPGGFAYLAEISIGTGIARGGSSVTTYDTLIATIEGEMAEPTSDGDAGDFFTYFEIVEDQDCDRTAAEKELRRKATYLIHAVGGFGSEPSLDFSLAANSMYLSLV